MKIISYKSILNKIKSPSSALARSEGMQLAVADTEGTQLAPGLVPPGKRTVRLRACLDGDFCPPNREGHATVIPWGFDQVTNADAEKTGATRLKHFSFLNFRADLKASCRLLLPTIAMLEDSAQFQVAFGDRFRLPDESLRKARLGTG